MKDLPVLYRMAVDEFGARVQAVAADQWDRASPCAGWDARQLVNHLVGEDRWAVPLLAGSTIDEVGDRLDGDLLGDDPKGAWTEAAAEALAAARAEGALDGTVHVSFGDISGREYLSQLVTDHVIHAWDLARAIGADDRLAPDLVEFVYGYIEPQADHWRAAGAFGPRVEVSPGADRQAQLLALAGRRS
ncbi:MAG: TIGR03086 family protein [Actinobacteria bacterium]|nr:TIGR03086 family protein [Actinomycetota bacterium]